MTTLCAEVLEALRGRRLATAESLTGGGIGTALTAVPGSSAVYVGGIISYTDEVKHRLLGVPLEDLERFGAVSAQVARAMAAGARQALGADAAISVTGLAGPGGDDYGHPVGTVFIGYLDEHHDIVEHYQFPGDREAVRTQTIRAALELALRCNTKEDPA